MNEKFYHLSKEKQDIMINAAIHAFALNGYERASTDHMIREAGISKGLLFHYFGNKKNLYQFVLEYCARYMKMELSQSISADEKNLFDRIRLVEEGKIRMLRNYKYLDLFLIRSASEQHEDVKESASEWHQEVEKTCNDIYMQADEALIRGNLTIQEAIEVTMLCMEGYKSRKYTECVEPEEVLSGFLPYLEILKTNMTR